MTTVTRATSLGPRNLNKPTWQSPHMCPLHRLLRIQSQLKRKIQYLFPGHSSIFRRCLLLLPLGHRKKIYIIRNILLKILLYKFNMINDMLSFASTLIKLKMIWISFFWYLLSGIHIGSSAQWATINSLRHPLNCTSFIAKQQQSCGMWNEKVSVMVWSFISLQCHFTLAPANWLK